jgi:WD40 repeat protein
VIDARWDPLSNNYIIVAFASGAMVLVDAEARKVISDFELQSTDLAMIDWHTAAPVCIFFTSFHSISYSLHFHLFISLYFQGEFVSVCSKTASLRVWHVSQRSCTRILRLGGNVPREGGCIGIKAFGPSTSASPVAVRNSKFLVTFCDGAVGVYDLAKHKMLWTGEPGHSETVFAGRFQPCNPRRFATASYDGRCKIWSIDRLSCEMELTGQPGALYALAWAPGDTKVEPEQRIITASSKGALWIWSTRTGLPLQKLQLHNLVRFFFLCSLSDF